MFNQERNMLNRTVVISFILGILVALFCVHAYTVYKMRPIVTQNQATVIQNQASISEIANFLNSAAQQASQPAAQPQI